MASTQLSLNSENTVNVSKPAAKLLQHEAVMLDLLGELMDLRLSIDRRSIASSHILVTQGDPEKVAEIVHNVFGEIDVRAVENDEEVLNVLNSLKEKFPGQFENDFERSTSTFKSAFHRQVKNEVESEIASLAIRNGRLAVSVHHMNYLQFHLNRIQEVVRASWPESAVSITVQKEDKGKGTLLISSKRFDFERIKVFIETFAAKVDKFSRSLEPSRALFLSNTGGQKEVKRLEREYNCRVSVLLPGHQMLVRAESPRGHQLFLCEGNMAATECNVLALPFNENRKEWIPTHRLILERGLHTTNTDLYGKIIGGFPKARMLKLQSQRPDDEQTVMLLHIPDQPSCQSLVVEDLAEGLAEAIRLSCARGTDIALPVAMSVQVSLDDNLKTVVNVVQDHLDKEENATTIVLYLEKSSAGTRQQLVETLEKTMSAHWKTVTDLDAVYEENDSLSPTLAIIGEVQDVEITFSKLQSIPVSKDFQERSSLLDINLKELHMSFGHHSAFYKEHTASSAFYTAHEPLLCSSDRRLREENYHHSKSQQTERPHVIKKLGSDVVDQFRENQDALRHLVTELSQIHGQFHWKLPDCIDVIATTSDIPEDWHKQVTKTLDRHKHLIEVNLGKGMNAVPDKKESQKLKRLAEGWVDCKEMPKGQIKERHSDVYLTPSSVTERYRPDVLNRLEKENKEILKEHQSMFYEEVIPNMKACQVKLMLKSQVLSMFQEKCKSVALMVDEEKSLVKVRVNTSQYDAMKMKVHVMEFMTKISERKIPLSAAMVKMFTNVQAHSYFQDALDRKGVACCLHLEFNSLSVSAHACHHEQIENILTSLFNEEVITLDEDKLASTKSSAWQELVDRLQQRDKERLPPPVVMLNVQKNVVAIVDVYENIARTLSAVKTFFSTNKMQEKIEKIDQNRCRYLHEFCAEELKQLQEQAKERGVSFKISKDGTVTFNGFHDSISVIDKEMKDFLKTIQSQQKTFSGPGVAAYLTSTRGQEYLQHTGNANGCLVTMSTGRVHETSESSDNVLARCRLEQGTELLIIQGDITKCHVDAIVNAANGDLHHAGGVALAIAKAGGKTIEEESRTLVMKYGPLTDGEVVVTGAGQLPCSYVLHAVGPMWQDGQKGEAACLQKTIMNILKMATLKHFSSVAIPSVFCGILGFPVDRATDIIVRSIVEYSVEHEDMCLKKIILIDDLNKKSLSGLLSAAKCYLEKSLTVTGEIRESSHMTPQNSKYKEESPRKSSEKAWEDRRSDPSKDEESRLPFRIISGDFTKSQVFQKLEGDSESHGHVAGYRDMGDRSPWSSSQVPLPAWKSVQVLVYSNKIGAAERVLETIDKHIKQNQKTKQEEDRVICRFSLEQRSAVMDLQEKYEVAIDLDTDQGVIKIAGLETNVLKAFAAVKDIKSESNKNQPITTSMMAIRWEYEVDKGKFRSFDPEHIMEIEAAYKKKAFAVNLTDKQGRKYQINFKDRKEYSLDNKNLRPIAVRRRDVVQEKSREIPLYNHWQHMSKGDKVKLVDLDPSSSEYKRVLLHFGGQAVKIQRVQNPTLFQQFKVKKKELEMHNPPGTENEQRLWHGTDSKNIDSIITNGFNRSYCGQHGTAYGQGVYFATNSSTSRGYASGGKMFQVRVLVGESTLGNSSMRMPPHKPGQNRPYDSLSGPGMFIIFHDSQAYPEYLITYQ